MKEAAMLVRVYNTLTRQKEEFTTVRPGKVGMYVCGPTVYKPSHVGHMVGPVIFDTVARFLRFLGYEVRFVVNITDVDDKLIVRAREEKTTVQELAERMTADYVECLRQLGVETITDMPRATAHVGEMIHIIQSLIDKGHAYAAAGDVYFDVTRDPDYGKLCNRDPEQLEAGARIEVSDKKRNPGDFALWKGAKPGEPFWDSPWGPGRPGWHIECSAMSMKYLGQTLDIHGGGLDLQFPHHENELAQSESYTEKPFAKYWMHNGLMKLGDRKMAGSVGNVVNVRDMLRTFPAETLRFVLLSTHYRSPIDFNESSIQQVQRGVDSFYRFFERYQRVTGGSFYAVKAPTRFAPFDLDGAPSEFLAEVSRLRGTFLEAMADDFNTGGAIGVLYELLTALNRFADARQLESPSAAPEAKAEFQRGVVVLRELGQILGLFREPVTTAKGGNEELVRGLTQLVNDLRDAAGQELPRDVDGLMRLLITLRAEARKAKNYKVADQIRERLEKLRIILEDHPGGTGWRVGDPPQRKQGQ
jgi:cysteinyl-tRNA synthetase